MARILLRNVACSPALDSNSFKTNSLVPTGDSPPTRIPLGTPLHTLASGSTRSATVCKAWMPSGTSPPLLKMQVLPCFRRILACSHNSSARMLHEPFTLIQAVRRLQESLTLRDVVNSPTKRLMGCCRRVSQTEQVRQPSHHGISGEKIESPNTIHRMIARGSQERLEHVGHALTPSTGLQSVLKW